jgi:inosine-uridine nucleoside N-ribohydrolase
MPDTSSLDKPKIPVILDTDIGTDIDDMWALVMLLKSPEIDLKLVVTDTGDATYRAKVVAKTLEIAGQTDIPVAVGLSVPDAPSTQSPWVEDYELSNYPGRVRQDGVNAIVETMMDSQDPVTLLCIGPVPNVAAALEQEPKIAERGRLVGMLGSVRVGYNKNPTVAAEYNVARAPQACKKAFAAPWEVTITPLDTCGIVQLRGERYRSVRDSDDPLVQALIENYRIWTRNFEWGANFDPEKESSILFDTVAVYLAFSEEYLVMESLGIRVTDEGYTRIDDGMKLIRCATGWESLPAFKEFLVQRLLS